MRLVIMGTGPFAVPTFNALLQSEHEVVCLVTRPERGRRSQRGTDNPMREVAEQAQLPVHDPASVNEPGFVEQLHSLASDLFVVCDYGQILSRDCLAASRLGGINLHGSLLPAYRGAAPINWAIYNGDRVTGVTVIHMTPRLDGGPILKKVEIPIDSSADAVSLEPVMAQAGVDAVLQSIDLLEQWDGRAKLGEVQDAALVTKAPRLAKQDGLVDWTRTATQIANQIRAFKPWPGSFTHWQRDQGDPLRLIIHAAVASNLEPQQSAGSVEKADGQQLWVAANQSVLEILEVQPSGKTRNENRRLPAGQPGTSRRSNELTLVPGHY